VCSSARAVETSFCRVESRATTIQPRFSNNDVNNNNNNNNVTTMQNNNVNINNVTQYKHNQQTNNQQTNKTSQTNYLGIAIQIRLFLLLAFLRMTATAEIEPKPAAAPAEKLLEHTVRVWQKDFGKMLQFPWQHNSVKVSFSLPKF
jgi:high-affinity Fe2+/Pb2+ permease